MTEELLKGRDYWLSVYKTLINQKIVLEWSARFLNAHADLLGNKGCNDFDLKQIFPEETDRRIFVNAYHLWNGDFDEWQQHPDLSLPDYAIVAFIAYLLRAA